MKEQIIKIIEEKIKSLHYYKSKIIDLLMIKENDEFALNQYDITNHQIYILEEILRQIKEL